MMNSPKRVGVVILRHVVLIHLLFSTSNATVLFLHFVRPNRVGAKVWEVHAKSVLCDRPR